jgi:hypothetical protein
VQLPRFRFPSSATALRSSVLLVAACADDPTGNDHRAPAEVRLLSPAEQSGTPGWPLADSVIVEVLDAQGHPISGVPVGWISNGGGARVGRDADTTTAAGLASAEWTLGLDEGGQTLSITVGQLDPVVVVATAGIFHAAFVTLGGQFACALNDGGQAYCWGMNNLGQLGNGTVGDPVLTPAPVAGNLTFSALTASSTHACGLGAGGEAYCWGSNDLGETGTGTMGGSISAPTAVQTSLRFTQISAEGTGFVNATCGLTAAGEAWCWGDNHFGQLGDGSTTGSAVPVKVQSTVPFSYIRAGYFHSCAVATTGELWCWGEQEADPGAFGALAVGLYTTPVLLHEDFRFTQLTTGRNYTCALTGEGVPYCWGSDFNGGLGQGQVTDGSAVPLEVTGGHTFVAISSSSFEETHGLADGGALYRWGSPGNDNTQATPVRFGQAAFLQADGGDEPFRGGQGTCGIFLTGAVYCSSDDGETRGVPRPVTP